MKFGKFKWKIFGIIALIISCVFMQCGVFAAVVASNAVKAEVSAQFSTGFATQSEENYAADEKNVASLRGVTVEINDAGAVGGYEKHVQIFGVPDDYSLSFVKVWPREFSKKEGSSFVSAGVDGDGNVGADKNNSCSGIKFDLNRNCYEFSFNPVFDGEGSSKWQEDGFDFLISLHRKNGDGGQARQLQLVVAKRDSWRDDVQLQLSDNAENCRWLKKIQITGIPSDVKLKFLRIWPFGSTMVGSSVFSPADDGKADGTDDERSSNIRFDEEKNCYEFLFNPVLDCGIHWVDAVDEANLSLKGFNVLAFLCKKNSGGLEGEAIEPLKFEVSNENLKQPSGLNELKNFSLNVVKNNLGEDCLEIKGLPGNVNKVYVGGIDWFGDGSETSERCEHDAGALKSKDGAFLVRFEPKSSKNGRYGADVSFSDDEGYRFFLCKHFRIS